MWRRLDPGDVWLPLLLGLAGCAPPVVAVTLGVKLFLLWSPSLWITIPLGIILAGADVVFWLMVWPHIRHEEKHLRVRECIAENADDPPEPKQGDRKVEVVVKADSQEYHDKRATLPDTAKMHNFAQAVLNGDPFAEKTAKRFGFSRNAWESLRDLFLDRAWVVWRNPHNHKEGLILLAAGRAALRGCLPYSDGEED